MKWKKISQIVKPIGYRTLIFKTYQMPDGTVQEFTTYGLQGSQVAAVIALTTDKKVVIARQYDPGPETVMDELPGGVVDKRESPEEAAKRELLEETGYQAGRMEKLGGAYRDAYSNGVAQYFMAYDCQKVAEQKLEPGEFVEVVLLTIEELLEVGRQGKLTDAAALFLAYEKLRAIQATT